LTGADGLLIYQMGCFDYFIALGITGLALSLVMKFFDKD
tara:strand:- start:765 stop:881 length:117 start_codon:yes stop_codon:yes gene_type:complete